MTTPARPGPRTTEFWLTVAADAAATVLLVVHRITPAEWTTITGGATAVYSLARSVVKVAPRRLPTPAPSATVAGPTGPATVTPPSGPRLP